MVVDAGGTPLLGVAFIFNETLEPSMANAVAIDSIPDPQFNQNGVSFSSQIQPIFLASCGNGSTCHVGAATPGQDLILDEGVAYDNIFGVPSDQFTDTNLVEPGQPMASYLYLKLLARSADVFYGGNRMPRGRPPLPDADIQLIADWISEGAPDN
jgi:hypothetical protein